MTPRSSSKIYINAAYRTPIGKFGGSLKRFTAPKLAAFLLKEAIARTAAGAPMTAPDFVIMGHARQAGCGPNTARQATIFSGLSDTIPAWTINHACSSGMAAVAQGVEKLWLGTARNLWVGGVESMTNTPYIVPTARWGQKLGNVPLVDAMYNDGFFCPMADMVMGETVEKFIAGPKKISRKAQDEWALLSHKRAAEAAAKKFFDGEIISIPAEGKNPALTQDEAVRTDSSLEALAKLPSAFGENGTLTAGNSSPITDGAAWLWISTERGPNALAEIIDFEMSALDPKLMGLGPVKCTTNLLARQKLQMKDIEVVELNEAFAAQVLAVQAELKIPTEKLNPRGGAIAIGHPIGASGARILTTLVHQLKDKSGALGLATLCVSGGQGYAMLLKAL